MVAVWFVVKNKGWSKLVARVTSRQRTLSVVCGVLLLVVSACGGGGGGSSSGGSNGGGNDSSSGVRVLHAAIDAAPVDLFSSLRTEGIVSGVVFADTKGYRRLPAGSQTLTLSRALDSAAKVASFEVTSSGDDSYSVLLYGSVAGGGLRTALIPDLLPSTGETSGVLVRFVHGLEGASSLSVAASGGDAKYSIGFGEASDYIVTGAGAVRLVARRGVDSVTVVSLTEQLEEGGVYTVLVAGEAGYYSKGVVFRDR